MINSTQKFIKRLAFVYQIDANVYWKDGLYAALMLVDNCATEEPEQISVSRTNYDSSLMRYFDERPDEAFVGDVVLVWGAFTSPQVEWVLKSEHPKAICFGGGPINHPYAHKFDVIFVEDEWTVREFRKIGIDAKLAFGTNTKLFKPMKLPKRWRYIYPAAFALWKNHKDFIELVKGYHFPNLAVGYMQPKDFESECWRVCMEAGIDVLPRVTPEVLSYLYNMSQEVIVTADIYGGGQRTILEALACGIPIYKHALNERLLTVLKKGLLTERDYADALLEGLKPLWNKTS